MNENLTSFSICALYKGDYFSKSRLYISIWNIDSYVHDNDIQRKKQRKRGAAQAISSLLSITYQSL